MPSVSPSNLELPLTSEMKEVSQVLIPQMERDEPIFGYFPEVPTDDTLLRWFQEDDWAGLTQIRGYNGRPPRVDLPAQNEYIVKPGVYGEHIPLDEETLTKRRQRAQDNRPIVIRDIIGKAFKILAVRRTARKAQVLWNLAVGGSFSVAARNGAIVHSDSYAQQTFAATIPWTTFATATPIADLRQIQQMSVGRSVDFGARATVFMNRVTFNNMVSNTNPADLGGHFLRAQVASFPSLGFTNQIFAAEDLPRIVIYDGGYPTETSPGSLVKAGFTKFLPNGKVQMMGVRADGGTIGEFRTTANIMSGSGEPYSLVIDKGTIQVPREVEVHHGFNFGVALYFPSAMVTGTVHA